MCRIAGIITQKKHSLKNYLRVRAMCDSLAHGGPDDDGIFLDQSGKICLGHRRLAILDLSSAGHQPMCSAKEDIWLSFNGEIYNFREIQKELEQKGFSFKTKTDTEVILKAYQHWGTHAFGRFEGMFAFALADLRSNKTYLVRGQNGIKPLYYNVRGNDLVFSSEVKAFSKGGFEMTENKDWKVLFLAFGHIPEPYTTLEGVMMLPKGHFMEWENDTAQYEIKEYFTYQYSKDIKDQRTAVELVKTEMIESVNRHLVSDAPLGVFLSGGVDSSILTLIADKCLGKNLTTVSLNFKETEFDETPYQQMISQKTSGEHCNYTITEEEFKKSFGSIVEAMDQPSTDGINTWFISKYASKNGLKTVLSGLGADEYFGGYPSFDRASTITWLKKLPKVLLNLTEKYPLTKIKRISYLGMKNPIGEYLFLRGCFTPGTIATILDITKDKVMEVLEHFPIPAQLNRLEGGNRISWFETNLYMQNQLLKDSDVMSMNHGIELRVPFLDHRLIKTILNVDPRIKFKKNQKKHLLINAFKDILPVDIWNRKKMGFTFPFQQWMQKSGVIGNEDLYSGQTSKKLIKAFTKGKLHWSAAFALYLVHQSATSEPTEIKEENSDITPLGNLLLRPFGILGKQTFYNKYSLN